MPKISKLIIFLFLGTLALFFLYKEQILTEPSLSQGEELLAKLTLEQKIGQMLLIGFEGKTLTPQLENLIKTIQPGGILLLSRNIEGEEQLKKLISDIQSVSLAQTGLPLFVAVDQEGGPVSRIQFLKELTPQAEVKDASHAYEVGLGRGKELKNLGINLNLAPVLDMTRPDDFLFERSFQKSAETTGELAKALILGQKEAGIFTAVKHYPGYGGIFFNPEREGLPVLAAIPEVSQFEKVLEANPEMIMTANVVYSEIDKEFPFTLSPEGIKFLKDKLKQDVLIISDDLSSPVLKKEFSLEKTIALAFKAGINILIVAGFDNSRDPLYAFNSLLKAVKAGNISEERINLQALEVTRLKQNLLK